MPDLFDDGTWREAALARMSEAFPTNRGLWPMYSDCAALPSAWPRFAERRFHRPDAVQMQHLGMRLEVADDYTTACSRETPSGTQMSSFANMIALIVP
jgi:hypothetical protein